MIENMSKNKTIASVFYIINPFNRTIEISNVTPETAELFSKMKKRDIDDWMTNIFFSDSEDPEWFFIRPSPIKSIPFIKLRFKGICYIGGFLTNPLNDGWRINSPRKSIQSISECIRWE